jgi:oligopeptide/dipeptide ABC transporter ATP-binding protein
LRGGFVVSLLRVHDLNVHFVARDRLDQVRTARALNGVSLQIERGQIFGLVGETGAGKSLTAHAVMQLLREPARRVKGSIQFEGQELTGLSEDAMNRLRGDRIALVVQSPKTSLDPLTRVGEQIARLHRVHRNASAQQAREKTLQMLQAVGIPDPQSRAQAWPHELSGGMAQRVLIAMALINDPQLIIADEPSTGLDVTVQAQILDLLRDSVRERRLASLLITHDLGVVAQYCDQVGVMFAGSLVEAGPVAEVFTRPRHPYTRHLLGSSPDRIVLGQAQIRAGSAPDLYNLPPGCPYQNRCPRAQDICRGPLMDLPEDARHGARCHFPEVG